MSLYVELETAKKPQSEVSDTQSHLVCRQKQVFSYTWTAGFSRKQRIGVQQEETRYGVSAGKGSPDRLEWKIF